MIYGTAEKTGQTGRTVGGRIRQLGTAARRAMDELLAIIYDPVTRKWLKTHLQKIQAGKGLHLACGNGEVSFMLASLLEGQTTLLGIEEDTTMLEAARRSGALRGLERVQFEHTDLFRRKADQPFDFIYVRIWAAALPDQDDLLQAIRQNLKESGVLFAEIVSLSGYQAYPYNHAFARSTEMIEMIEHTRPDAVALPEQIQEMLKQSGFDSIDMTSTLPAFVPRDCNHIVSLALEACRDAILHCRGSTAEELNALLLELREFEQQDDTLISRPGLLQLAARPVSLT